MNNISIGEKIEQYVDYLGYTDEELNKVFNFDSKKILSIYNNEYIPNVKEQEKFAILFNISKEELSNGLSIDEVAMNEQFINRQNSLNNIKEENSLNIEDKKELNKFRNYLKRR